MRWCKTEISGCANSNESRKTDANFRNPGCADAHPQCYLAPPLIIIKNLNNKKKSKD
jgi:hypothetical protein